MRTFSAAIGGVREGESCLPSFFKAVDPIANSQPDSLKGARGIFFEYDRHALDYNIPKGSQ